MSDNGKDAGLVSMIGSILGGGKRAESAAPPPLTQAPPTVPTSGFEAVAAPPQTEAPKREEDASNGVAAPAKPIEPSIQVVTQADGKRRLPADIIAELVLGELRKISGFPASGVSVTVYGFRHWNAMITFAPFSTTFQNATRFRQAIPDIVFKLRRLVDLEI